jgi:hypothetical protein
MIFKENIHLYLISWNLPDLNINKATVRAFLFVYWRTPSTEPRRGLALVSQGG